MPVCGAIAFPDYFSGKDTPGLERYSMAMTASPMKSKYSAISSSKSEAKIY